MSSLHSGLEGPCLGKAITSTTSCLWDLRVRGFAVAGQWEMHHPHSVSLSLLADQLLSSSVAVLKMTQETAASLGIQHGQMVRFRWVSSCQRLVSPGMAFATGLSFPAFSTSLPLLACGSMQKLKQ